MSARILALALPAALFALSGHAAPKPSPRPFPLPSGKISLTDLVESEVARMKARIKVKPEDDRGLLARKAYPAAEALEKVLETASDFTRSDALLVTGLTRDLLGVDPNYYGDPAETFFALSSRPAFVALLKECKLSSRKPLPAQTGLPHSVPPVRAGDVCAMKQLFEDIAREHREGNGN